MSYLLTARRKTKDLFESLDKIKIGKKGLFSWFVPFWQNALYLAIIVYFLLTLAFQPVNYQFTKGIINPFLVLLSEIANYHGVIMNPILNRGLDNGGHILAYLSLIFLAFYARAKLPKTAEGCYYSLLIPGMALATSEGLFNVFYWAFNYHLWPHPSWFVFLLTNPLAALYIFTTLIGLFVTPIWKFISLQRFVFCVLVIVSYFTVWTMIGLPVTLSSINYIRGFGLETVFYYNLFVNSIEIGQWGLASFVFGLALRSPHLTPRPLATTTKTMPSVDFTHKS